MTIPANNLLASTLRLFAAEVGYADRGHVAYCLTPSGGVFATGLAHVDKVSLLTLTVEGHRARTAFVLRKFDLRYDAREGVICRGDRVRGWNLMAENDVANLPAHDPSLALAVHGLLEVLVDGAVADAAATPATAIAPWVVVPVGNTIEQARPDFRWFVRDGALAAPLSDVLAASSVATPSSRKFIHLASAPLAGRTTLAAFRAARAAGMISGPKRHSSWVASMDDEGHAEWLGATAAPVLDGDDSALLAKFREQLGPLAVSLLTTENVRSCTWHGAFEDVRVPLQVGARLPACRLAVAAGLYTAPGVRLEFPEFCQPAVEEARLPRGAHTGVDPLMEVRFEAFATAAGN